ncbi:hypothetical protein PspTeo4_29136 [Pseudomonas sp. Teo4]|nr:hypothetical protein [Pseudomonas sp. Teo4]
MKTCTVFGDMQSDSTSEQYPTINLCNDCIERDAQAGEEHQIVCQGAYDVYFGCRCEWCGVSLEEEEEEGKSNA